MSLSGAFVQVIPEFGTSIGYTRPHRFPIRSGGAVGGVVIGLSDMILGVLSGMVGRVALVGDGSLVAVGNLVVGGSGKGQVNVADGARLQSVQAKVGGGASTGDGLGEVLIQGSLLSPAVWEVNGNLDVGTGGDDTGAMTLAGVSLGPLSVGGATLTVGGTLTVGPKGFIGGNGTLTAANRVINGGLISPGLSPGVITVEGDYEQPAGGVLEIEIGGTEPGQFDVLHITGNAALAGSVDLGFINGFVPPRGFAVDFVVVDGTVTGKLTGDGLIDVPGNEIADGTSNTIVVAEVKWDVTPEGTCRLTVTDVQPVSDGTRDIPGCGAGLCGAGVVPMLPATLVGMAAMRSANRRRRDRFGRSRDDQPA